MTSLPFRLYDSLGRRPGEGNPAAVFLLDAWLPDEQLAAVAGELNAWTAFAVGEGADWQVRIFTIPPIVETALCGHGLLATARRLFDGPALSHERVVLTTRDGPVPAYRTDRGATLDFPAIQATPSEPPPSEVVDALGGTPRGWWRRIEGYPAWIALYDSAAELAALPADPLALRAVEALFLATAPDETGEAEVASRLFQPMKSLIEDPAGGTQHALAAPFWAQRLGKASVRCRSASPRGGRANCTIRGERLLIEAPVTLSAEGVLFR